MATSCFILRLTSELTDRPAAPLRLEVWVSNVHSQIELWAGWRFLSSILLGPWFRDVFLAPGLRERIPAPLEVSIFETYVMIGSVSNQALKCT